MNMIHLVYSSTACLSICAHFCLLSHLLFCLSCFMSISLVHLICLVSRHYSLYFTITIPCLYMLKFHVIWMYACSVAIEYSSFKFRSFLNSNFAKTVFGNVRNTCTGMRKVQRIKLQYFTNFDANRIIKVKFDMGVQELDSHMVFIYRHQRNGFQAKILYSVFSST